MNNQNTKQYGKIPLPPKPKIGEQPYQEIPSFSQKKESPYQPLPAFGPSTSFKEQPTQPQVNTSGYDKLPVFDKKENDYAKLPDLSDPPKYNNYNPIPTPYNVIPEKKKSDYQNVQQVMDNFDASKVSRNIKCHIELTKNYSKSRLTIDSILLSLNRLANVSLKNEIKAFIEKSVSYTHLRAHET